jgi:lipid A 3-O-deacylase
MVVGCLFLVPALLPGAAAAAEAASVGFGAGIFDTAAWTDDKGDFDAIEAGVVLRGATDWALGIGPMAGVSANDDGAIWVYGGARRPFHLGSCWQAGPTFAAVYYEQGDSKNLGNELEFRSGLEIYCRATSGRALGIEFYHMSNAGISDVNPGANSLWIVYSVPLGRTR